MKHKNDTSAFTFHVVATILILYGLAVLSGCSSTAESGATAGDTPSSEAGTRAAGVESANKDSGAATTENTGVAAAQAEPAQNTVEPEATVPQRIVESCKDEAYIKYEQQSRDSIAKGLAATKEQKFGVGFRSVDEHNTWSKIHNELFKQVNAACGVLSECAKTHKKDKDTECVDQAKTFDEWQKLAKDFAAKAKTAESTQPPKICSLTPSLDDAARCFHGLADNIDKACDSDNCKETSNCWRSIGFLDAAIIQAEQSCGFVHQKLSDCRGYTEATDRRKKKFGQCKDFQGQLNITVFPVL